MKAVGTLAHLDLQLIYLKKNCLDIDAHPTEEVW